MVFNSFINFMYVFQEYQIIDFDKSWATVALKLACSWACGLIYLLFLLMPDQCCCSVFSVFIGSDPEPIMVSGNGLLRNELTLRQNRKCAPSVYFHESEFQPLALWLSSFMKLFIFKKSNNGSTHLLHLNHVQFPFN